MKKIALLIIIGLLILINYSFGQTWEWQYPKPQGADLWGVCFTDSVTAYAVGGIGRGEILKTINGGDNWITLYTGCYNGFSKILFTSKDTGYVITIGTILKTTDAGQSWLYLNLNIPSYLTVYDLCFPDKDIGYTAFGANGVYKTTDAGTNWHFKSIGNISVKSIYFINANIGYVAGDNSKMFKTDDGGLTWQQVNFQPGLDSLSFDNLYFANQNIGYASGTKPAGNGYRDYVLIKTIDGGLHWNILNVTDDYWYYYSTNFTSADTGYIVGGVYNSTENKFYNILKTTDGGITWNYFSPRYWDFDIITFTRIALYKQNVLAVGWSGLIGKSIDGGQNWTLLSSEPQSSFWDICFINKNKGFIVGDGGILKTTNGGTDWIKQDFGIPYGVNVCFPDSTTGYINSYFTLYKSNNGGDIWDSVSAYDIKCVSMYFITRDTGYLAGYDGTIMKTVDGGNTWSIKQTGTDNIFESIQFPTKSTGFARAWNQLLKTDDGGETWSNLTTPLSQCNSIFFTSNETGYISGLIPAPNNWSDPVNYKTIDGGQTWTKLNTKNRYLLGGDYQEFSGIISFINDSVGFIWGHGGVYSSFLKTIDAGKTWEFYQNTTGQYQISDAFFTDENTGYLISPFSQIVKFVINENNKEQWAPDGAEWHYSFTNIDKEGYIKIYPTGDTIIQDLKFRILQKESVYYDYSLQNIDTLALGKEYMREEYGNIVWYKNDSIYVLYDFQTTPGNRWDIPGTFTDQCESMGTVNMDSKEFININGQNLLKIYLSTYSGSNYHIGNQAIEHIGSIDSYLLPEPTLLCDIGNLNHGGPFRCYSDSTFGLYSTNIAPFCDYTIGIQAVDYNPQFIAYPNPAKEFILFDYSMPKGRYNLKIYDGRGVLLESLEIAGGSNKVKWDTYNITPGMYFYSVFQKYLNISGKIIITR